MAKEERDIEFLYDVELELSVILGSSRMLIRELLQLGTGSVVELNKLAGESLDVVINDKVIARGEAVVVNEKFGIRLTEVVSPYERVRQLRD
ncbi:MAG: flagellar motor switch protein FliN [Myxococcales bacterium]|nr:flagellar motor switch protein FliN [Myxococcales bacterium]MCB9542182.1 flagellar motor switch protein FliN [Myxococcales bacterium]MCB9553210.1 flagellar motor switch protein FliN [Myxococcales bacterium]